MLLALLIIVWTWYFTSVSLAVHSSGAIAAAPLAALGGGYGIAGMRERAALIGAALSAGPCPGGWQVEARLPR